MVLNYTILDCHRVGGDVETISIVTSRVSVGLMREVIPISLRLTLRYGYVEPYSRVGSITSSWTVLEYQIFLVRYQTKEGAHRY